MEQHLERKLLLPKEPDISQLMTKWRSVNIDRYNILDLVLDVMRAAQTIKKVKGHDKKRWVTRIVTDMITELVVDEDTNGELKFFIDNFMETTVDFIAFISHNKRLLIQTCSMKTCC